MTGRVRNDTTVCVDDFLPIVDKAALGGGLDALELSVDSHVGASVSEVVSS